MENASKALIIAGAVLVSILIVSLGVMLFNNMGGAAKDMADMDEQEIAAFNSKITPYLGERVSGSQVNALIQYVISNNIAATRTQERAKAINITFPANAAGIYVNDDCTAVEYGSNVKRVDTGASNFYHVRGQHDSNGLITTITVN